MGERTPPSPLGPKGGMGGVHLRLPYRQERVPVRPPLAGATQTLFLVGDSHTIALSKAVADAGRQHRLNVVIRSRGGCSFAIFPDDGDTQSTECRSWVQEISDEIRTGKPQVVVIHQCARVGVGCPPSGLEWLPTWQEGLTTAVTDVLPHTKGVVIIQDVPRFEHDISGCMTAFRVAQGCGEQRTPEVEVQAAPVAAAAEQAVYGLQGIVVVDPIPVICEPILCRQVVSGKVMYHDTNHLTTRGADRLVPLLSQAVGQVLEGSR